MGLLGSDMVVVCFLVCLIVIVGCYKKIVLRGGFFMVVCVVLGKCFGWFVV